MDKEQPPLTPPEGGECCAQTLLFNGYNFYLSVKGFQILNNKKKSNRHPQLFPTRGAGGDKKFLH
jgi:hypothetical protein